MVTSVPAGLFGVDDGLDFPEPVLRGAGQVSPLASATALRRSASSLLGRPRFRGGSSIPGDTRVEAPLFSLL